MADEALARPMSGLRTLMQMPRLRMLPDRTDTERHTLESAFTVFLFRRWRRYRHKVA